MKALLNTALDLLYPPQALDGGAALSHGLSAAAWGRINFISAPLCDGCAQPFEFDPHGRCPSCLAKPRAFARARAACLYDEHSRDLILQFKHADRTDLAPLLTQWLSRAGADLLVQADAIAPVPLHRGRLFRRKYNQAAELARPLARQHGLTFLPDALVRTRDTGSQGGKSGSGRRRNVTGAFDVRQPVLVAGRRIVLVDDVMTTGATAEGCARALLKAGAASVDVLVLARVKESPNTTI